MRAPWLACSALCVLLVGGRAQADQADAGPVEVIEHIDVQPSQTEAARAAMLSYRAALLQEDGDIDAAAIEETGRPTRFAIVERWKDERTYEASRSAASREQFEHALGPMERAPIDERPQSDILVRHVGSPTPSTIFVLTHIDVTPPRRPKAEDTLNKLIAATRSANGVLTFDVFRQVGQPNHFTLFQVWSDMEAFDAHADAPATVEFRRAIGPLLGALYDERLYKEVE